jgi:catechol 2,3-dioxygenase-like lactoylglutathione lyase family enzyme
MSDEHHFPQLFQVVLDCPDARQLAEFYRELLGYQYRPGHEKVDPAGDDWLVIVDPDTGARVAFQQVDSLPVSTWPDNDGVPQQLHLDLTVPSIEELDRHHERALSLGGRLALDRSDHEEEPLRVYADPAGHPFCIFVA